MYSFTCDYTEGAHPKILQKLAETNMVQEPGYGEDSFCASARERIRQAIGCLDADIFFLVGGTQTNSTVIDGLLDGCQGVLAAQTGHIAVHEAGAIEFSGHKVLTLPQHQGKIDAGELKAWQARSGLPLRKFFNTSGLLYKYMGLKEKLAGLSSQVQHAIKENFIWRFPAQAFARSCVKLLDGL